MAFAVQGSPQEHCFAPRAVRGRHIRAPKLPGEPQGSRGIAAPAAASAYSGRHSKVAQEDAKSPQQQWHNWSDEQECIQVAESFEAAEGAALSDDYTIAKHIGSGTSADVYKLQPNSSSAAGGKGAELVLKMAKAVPGLRRAFQREWMLGRRLNAVAAQAPELNMIIHTGPAVVSVSDKGRTVFRGAVLEGVNGKSLDKRLEQDASFCDVDFLTNMLQQVLTALQKAHSLVGFSHGDLRISNIMEHAHDPAAFQELLQNPETWQKQGYESAASAALARGVLTFKILDFGHSKINERRARSYLKLQPPYSSAAAAGRSSSSSQQCGALALQRLPPSKGLLEAFYSFWYRGKSDAWRLLRSLATRLDGRAWPKRKQQQVLALYKLMEDVLDLKLQARFFQDEVTGLDGQIRRVGSADKVFDEAGGGFVEVREVAVLDVTAKPRRFKLLRGLREKLLRLWSRLFSRKPSVTPKEVLNRMRDLGLLQQ